MRIFTAVIERCPEIGLLVGYIPGFPGAHSQGGTLEGLQENLSEVVAMLLEDGEPKKEQEMTHNVALRHSEEGYSATVPALPGCCSQGSTKAEALVNIAEAIREYLEVAAKLAEEADILS